MGNPKNLRPGKPQNPFLKPQIPPLKEVHLAFLKKNPQKSFFQKSGLGI